jgi:hypothetical protein
MDPSGSSGEQYPRGLRPERPGRYSPTHTGWQPALFSKGFGVFLLPLWKETRENHAEFPVFLLVSTLEADSHFVGPRAMHTKQEELLLR